MKTTPCILFAGGKSSRMGRDKTLMDFGGKVLVQYQYERLKNIFKNVYISTKSDKFPFKAPLLIDKHKEYVPTPALVQALKEFGEIFVLSADAPFIDKDIIEELFKKAKKYPQKMAIVAKTSFIHPLIGIYRPSFLPLLEKAIKNREYKLQYLLHQADTLFVSFEDETKFLNLNYPQEFQEALKKIC